MPTVRVQTKEVNAIADSEHGVLSLHVHGEQSFKRLHKALQRALNCDDQAPQWLFDLCDSMETQPIPKRRNDREQQAVEELVSKLY